MSLTDFLLARIAEDEARARKFHPEESLHVHFAGDQEPTVLYTAARVLVECEAKRRIVSIHHASTDHGERFSPYCVGCWEDGGMDGAPTFPCRTLRALALPYADHDDYREEWKP